jgi:hypothetical protein
MSDDLLLQIFGYSTANDYSDTDPNANTPALSSSTLCRLSLVCKRWRDVIRDEPKTLRHFQRRARYIGEFFYNVNLYMADRSPSGGQVGWRKEAKGGDRTTHPPVKITKFHMHMSSALYRFSASLPDELATAILRMSRSRDANKTKPRHYYKTCVAPFRNYHVLPPLHLFGRWCLRAVTCPTVATDFVHI